MVLVDVVHLDGCIEPEMAKSPVAFDLLSIFLRMILYVRVHRGNTVVITTIRLMRSPIMIICCIRCIFY
jgi:hypothetical protein